MRPSAVICLLSAVQLFSSTGYAQYTAKLVNGQPVSSNMDQADLALEERLLGALAYPRARAAPDLAPPDPGRAGASLACPAGVYAYRS